MGAWKTIEGLSSQDERAMLEAIYNIDESFVGNVDVMEKLRKLIYHSSPDVREISIMRLACRLNDDSIYDKLKDNLLQNLDGLTFSASVRGLVCLSLQSEGRRGDLISFLNALDYASMDEEGRNIVRQAMVDIKRLKVKYR